MNITECIPLAGQGLVARRGHLVALTGGTDAGPDPLLTALTAVAYANGDGAALVLAATRAAAEHGGRPAWACAGVTLGEEVAVLVHGEAVALVSVDGSPEARVTARDSMIPVVGTFTGAVVTVRLVIGPPAPPDPRLWLEGGTVFGGGIALAIRQVKPSNLIPNDPHAPAAAAMRPAVEQAAEHMLLHPPAAGPAVSAVPAPAGVAPGEVYPQDELRLRRVSLPNIFGQRLRRRGLDLRADFQFWRFTNQTMRYEVGLTVANLSLTRNCLAFAGDGNSHTGLQPVTGDRKHGGRSTEYRP